MIPTPEEIAAKVLPCAFCDGTDIVTLKTEADDFWQHCEGDYAELYRFGQKDNASPSFRGVVL